jgi:O-methyltransferase involved in polyketide biosynthesis
MKILREDEKEVLQFANGHPVASIGRLITTARSRIAEHALSKVVERGIRQIVILGAGLDTFALRNPHGARRIEKRVNLRRLVGVSRGRNERSKAKQ